MTASSKKGSSKGSAATVAIVLVTSLFFVWGLTMNLVNALNSPMANYLELSGTEASLLQVAYYGAYFVMAIPASIVAKKFGYKGGVVMGHSAFRAGFAHHGARHQCRILRHLSSCHVRDCSWRLHPGDQLQPLHHQAG